MLWSYGVTTVPERRAELLPRTLASLAAAGFDRPRLFVDGAGSDLQAEYKRQFNLEVTSRFPALRTYGNWILSLIELFIREPLSHRFAIFQDDLLAVRNLRQYLEATPYPRGGYLNLLTFFQNEEVIAGKPRGQWYEAALLRRGGKITDERLQTGKGALALVFDREAVLALLTNQESAGHLVLRPLDQHRGWRAVDGAIVTAMNSAGFREFIHNPSLVQHTGTRSSMGNPRHPRALSYEEDSDALKFIGKGTTTSERAQSDVQEPPETAHRPPSGEANDPALAAEIGRLREALAQDRLRLAGEMNPNGRRLLLGWIRTYEMRLARLGVR